MSAKVKFLTDMLRLFSSSGRLKGYDSGRFPTKARVVSAGEGCCVCELTVDEDLVNVNNDLHGGCTATIVDMATAVTQWTCEKPYAGVSIELSVSYLAAAKLGDEIVIDTKTIKRGKTLAFYHVDITRKSDGAKIAVGKHTQFVVPGVAKSPEEILKNIPILFQNGGIYADVS